ncbi:MAG: hypothetical protein WD851_12540 [Pirellulales bacterium]
MSEHLSNKAAFGPFCTPEFPIPAAMASDAELQQKFREPQQGWQPCTKLGQRLKELRQEFVDAGGRLLSESKIDRELRERRGTLYSEN